MPYASSTFCPSSSSRVFLPSDLAFSIALLAAAVSASNLWGLAVPVLAVSAKRSIALRALIAPSAYV